MFYVFCFLQAVFSRRARQRPARSDSSHAFLPVPLLPVHTQVARTLVQIYHELGNSGTSPTLAALSAKPAPPLGNSLREAVDRDGTVVGTARANAAGGDGSSSDEEGEGGDGGGGCGGDAAPAQPRQPRPAPVVDDDGFTTVARRRR